MKFPVIVKRLLENKIVSVTKSLTVKNSEKQDVKIHELPSEESDNAQENLSNFEEFVLAGHDRGDWRIVYEDEIKTKDINEYFNIREIHGLDESLKKGFAERVPKISAFQKNSFKAIMTGESVAITAPTGSGKTESFLIPIFQKILEHKNQVGTFCVLVYPTNALARDQIVKINEYAELCGFGKNFAKIANSSISLDYRNSIRNNPPKILVTTIDTIHWSLAGKYYAEKSLKQCKIFVLDEAHTYSGFFGSNTHHVIQRLKYFIPKCQFIGASATLDNALDFCEKLFDIKMLDVKGVSREKDQKRYIIAPRKLSSLGIIGKMTTALIADEHQTLCFSNTREHAEIIKTEVQKAKPENFDEQIKIQVHHAGIEPSNQLGIFESEMRDEQIHALSCTSTLELGIDIGNVTGVVSEFSNDLDKFLQRIGRAGRRGTRSFGVMVLKDNDPFSHYYSENIEEYFEQPMQVQIESDNPLISQKHKMFAQFDKLEYDAKKELEQYNIRGIGDSLKIFYQNRIISKVPQPFANQKLFNGGIFRNNGEIFRSLGIRNNSATVELSPKDEYFKTTPNLVNKYKIKRIVETKIFKNLRIEYCVFEINSSINSFKKESIVGQKNEDSDHALETKDQISWQGEFTGLRITFLKSGLDIFFKGDLEQKSSIFHTTTHLLMNAGCIVARCDPGDLGEIIDSEHMIIFDNASMGTNGMSQLLFGNFHKVLNTALKIVSSCKCHIEEDGEIKNPAIGCPNCTFIQSFCGEFNKNLNKLDAQSFLLEFTIFYEELTVEDRFNKNQKTEKDKNFEKKCTECNRFNDSISHTLCENCEVNNIMQGIDEKYRAEARRIIHYFRWFDDEEYYKNTTYSSNKQQNKQQKKKKNTTTHYDVLKIEIGATQEEIKKSYKKLVIIWHPDRNDSPNAEEEFKKITNAYDILKDPISRKAYDAKHAIA